MAMTMKKVPLARAPLRLNERIMDTVSKCEPSTLTAKLNCVCIALLAERDLESNYSTKLTGI